MKAIRKSLNIYILLISFLSCSNQNASFKKIGLGFNAKRKILGLPLLPQNWKLTNDRNEFFQWITSSKNKDSLVFFSKEVKMKNNQIYSEYNSFFGGKKYHTVDGTFFERLWIGCIFDQNGNVSKWDCTYTVSENKFDHDDFEIDKPITKYQADSIIARWGLKYVFK